MPRRSGVIFRCCSFVCWDPLDSKARGVKLGRKPELTLHHRKHALARREHGKESMTDIARSYNVSHSAISRLRA